jgi:uncharacterized protein (TIGR03084 family)
MADLLPTLLTDLGQQSAALEVILTPLPATGWDLPTLATGWLVRDQVSHLAYFDQAAVLSATEPERFEQQMAQLLRGSGEGFPDVIAQRYRAMPPEQLDRWWRDARRELVAVFAGLDPALRVPWYGPPMSVASALTARLMETWAHGQDVAEAIGVRWGSTAGLRHICHLGVRTFAHSYRLHGIDVPDRSVRVELTAPDGSTWAWGPPGAADRVSGPALDFCRVVTQRRNVADTNLAVVGDVARQWMSLAQAYAGAPGPGRPAMSRSGKGADDG